MGCGLRKLEDAEDSSPGKIFSTLKRPQVETKTEFAYEYVLLDFTLQASPNPEVIKINSIPDIVTKVEDYYLQGYTVGAIHPVIQPVRPRRRLPASYLYRAVLWRPKPSPKHSPAPGGQRRPRLVIEACPLTYETQTNDVAKELIEKINVASKRGMRFVGFVSQHAPPLCNGTDHGGDGTDHGGDGECALPVRQASEENSKGWNEGTLSGHSSESGIEDEWQHESGQSQTDREGSPSAPEPERGGDNKLYIVFNMFDEASTCWTYQEGVLSVKVTRKGSVISTLDADWLELTTFYYKQGLSLIDSFVCWETSKGDHVPKSLEGFFVYEEEGAGVPGAGGKGNDAIVVEQWTVIEGCDIKTDYGPLLHTLAEFGWLLTSVLPTPVLRHDSEGNLATKQVVFLQRPAIWSSAAPTPERKASRRPRGEARSRAAGRSLGPDTAPAPAPGGRPAEGALPAPAEPWAREMPAGHGGLPGLGLDARLLRDLDEGQLDQEDGVAQVTCM